ncbi:MAG TPA: mannose-1-phosphate guanylyltransferase [Thermoanaerobaculia bacterium]|nr:mannose-1-phosphate guanylyltransferase [Thermoanaerobaculia bacterium]
MRALILAGGSGTRFWPLSRKSNPKQLLALEGERSLLRETVERLRPLVEPKDVWVCTTAALAERVHGDLPEVPPEQILAEPQGRNTAPAIGWSIRSMPEEARRGVVAVLPADHRMGDPAAFRDALGRAGRVVEREDRVMTLGVVPRWAETGYGYLELEPEAGPEGVRRVRRFVEKPSPENAARFVAAGHYLWNAGIFVFRGTTLLSILERLQPELARGLEEIANVSDSPDQLAELYGRLPSDSIDYAVMEKLDDISTLPLDCGWSDLGSWEALDEVLPRDEGGNAGRGDRLAVDAHGNLLFADAGTIAVLGVEDLVVVRTGDAVLVCPKSRSQEVKKLVAELAARGREDLL